MFEAETRTRYHKLGVDTTRVADGRTVKGARKGL